VGSILVRCVRFDELVAFWQAALGYVPRDPPEDGWVVLADPTGAGPNISLDRVEQERLPPLGELSRVHLDLYTSDQQGEVERLLALGATGFIAVGVALTFSAVIDPELPAAHWPWLPLLFIVSVLLVIVLGFIDNPRNTGIGVLIMAAGVPVYYAWRARAGRAAR